MTQGRKLFKDNFDSNELDNIPLAISYVCIDSEKGEIGYGTKLYLVNGTFKRLIQGRIKDGEKLDGYGKMFYNPEKTYYYVGDWVDGKKHGKGTYISKN